MREAELTQHRQGPSTDPRIGAGETRVLDHRTGPQTIGIEPVPRRELQHPVILGDDMQPTARTQDPPALGEHRLGIGQQLREVATGDEIEVPIRKTQRTAVSDLEHGARPARRDRGAAEAVCGLHHRGEQVYPDDLGGPWKEP